MLTPSLSVKSDNRKGGKAENSIISPTLFVKVKVLNFSPL